MKLLDLFCGAGGAAMGYHRAGFDEIVGVDISEQRHYPFRFVKGDALVVLGWMKTHGGRFPIDHKDGRREWLGPFDAVHASPPCQKYSAATRHLAHDKPKLIEPLRAQLDAYWYVIENTPGAPLQQPITLCGLSLGLNVKRHRLFESNLPLQGTTCVPNHPGNWLVIFGHECRSRRHGHAAGRKNKLADGRAAMGIPWMTRGELSESIPPAYTEYIGRQLLAHLRSQQERTA